MNWSLDTTSWSFSSKLRKTLLCSPSYAFVRRLPSAHQSRLKMPTKNVYTHQPYSLNASQELEALHEDPKISTPLSTFESRSSSASPTTSAFANNRRRRTRHVVHMPDDVHGKVLFKDSDEVGSQSSSSGETMSVASASHTGSHQVCTPTPTVRRQSSELSKHSNASKLIF